MSNTNNAATQYSVRDGIAVITMTSPPVNGLGHALRGGLMNDLHAAAADAAVSAVVIIGSAKAFSGGADIREFNTPQKDIPPSLPEVNVFQDSMAKPLVAAIGGFALGGGLELALACHYRVAQPRALFGLPEVKLGILPGSGGTQRLPRIVPVAEALSMMITGNPIPAEKAREYGLVDEIVTGDLLEGAIAFAKKLLADGKGPRRIRDMKAKFDGDVASYFDEALARAAREQRGQPAPLEIIKCVRDAVTIPFDDGQAESWKRVQMLVNTIESKALRHMFFGERQTTKMPDVPDDTPQRAIQSAAVIGAGTMGGGIAMSLANAGIPVTLIEMKQEALDRGLGNITKNYASTVSKGRLTQQKMDERMALITPALDLAAAKDADLVIEAVFERMDVKQEVFRKLDAVAKAGAILATNTSTLDVNQIAAVTKRPQDVIGLHFFSPANVMRLLEVVRAAKTGKDVLATSLALGKKIGKVPVVADISKTMSDGFIGNRMLDKYMRQSLYLVEEGASPAQVDKAATDWGLAMGPFTMGDMAGLDISWDVRKRHYAEDAKFEYPRVADRICEAGRFGQKTGKGWYRYEPGNRKPLPDPEAEAIIAAYRKEVGIAPRDIPEQEIVERLVYALTNEGARILEGGIALRASDIDITYLMGYGFPHYRGGPMFWADAQGLDKVLARIEVFHKGYRGEHWKPAPLLVKFAAEKKTFNS
jgi:3-hydroxyacyl-CoA dehydrogenase